MGITFITCSFTAESSGPAWEDISRMKSYRPSPKDASRSSKNSSYASTDSHVSSVSPSASTDQPFSASRVAATPFTESSHFVLRIAKAARIFGTKVIGGTVRPVGMYRWLDVRKYATNADPRDMIPY